MKPNFITATLLAALAATGTASADDAVRADSHAPIGVMGDHTHAAGEWMFSYRYMRMEMAGNLQGDESIAPDTIVTTEPNRFAGMPGMPPTLRIVPLDMDMTMHMPGLMYAPSDTVTLMLMGTYWQKSMAHRTYMGGMGTTVLGDFDVTTSGWGDTTATALVRIAHNATYRLHLAAGLSLPTGSTDEEATVLTPMNMRPTQRTPYPMQLGSGTWDPIIGATIASTGHGRFGWGAQWRSTFRLTDNDDDYRLGDEHRLTAWASWLWSDAVSTSARVAWYDRDNISGIDPQIMGPVQTADPDRQALTRMDAGLGLNVVGTGRLRGWRFGVEYLVPLLQDVDGPQLETDAEWLIGVQKTVY